MEKIDADDIYVAFHEGKINSSNEYYSATEVDAMLNDVQALVEAAKESHCPKCGGAGWCWGYELDDPDNDTATDAMTRYSCDWCRNLLQAIAAVERLMPKEGCDEFSKKT